MIRNQKGITLIALVITIIVLLILAGVSIAMLTGDNGILTNASKATVTNIEGRVEEEVRLAVQAARLEIENNTAKDKSWSAVTNISTIVTTLQADLKDGYEVKVKDGTADTISITYTGSDYTKATNKSTANILYEVKVTQHNVSLGAATITK